MNAAALPLRACVTCGLVQEVAPLPPTHRALCARCGAVVLHPRRPAGMSRAAAFSLAALILYPASMMLPVIEVERLGHHHSATIWSGVVELLAEGQWAVGLIIFACSIVVPLLKIAGMFVLCTGNVLLPAQHRLHTYRAVEWIGRWGMIDVLLVALLVAAVKLGNWMNVHPGSGVLAFAGVVLLSMLSSACFDKAAIWESP